MNCKKCGSKLNDSDKYCMECEAKNEQTHQKNDNNKKKGSKSRLIVGIILSIIGIGVTIGTFFFFGPFLGFMYLIPGNILLFNSILYKTKKGIRILLDILLTILVCMITCFVAVDIWKLSYVKTNDVLDYLNNKYGEEINFSLSSKKCSTQSNTCYYYFTEQNLNGEIFVVKAEVDSSGSKNFKDTYISVKYDKRLKEEYSAYFSTILNEGFNISFINIFDSYNIPSISYSEYRNLLIDKELSIYLQPTLKLDLSNKYFHLKTTDKSVKNSDLQIAQTEINEFIDKNFDINKLKQDVTDIIKVNDLNNITSVLFDFDDCKEDEYMDSCRKIIELYNNYSGNNY